MFPNIPENPRLWTWANNLAFSSLFGDLKYFSENISHHYTNASAIALTSWFEYNDSSFLFYLIYLFNFEKRIQ